MSFTSVYAENDEISVYLNNNKLTFKQEPIIRNDSTLVPFRAIFEELNMTVQWYQNQQRVTAEDENTSITLFIGDSEMIVNNEIIKLLTPPIIYNDYTLVPLRAVSEAAGAEVSWDDETRSVYINTESDNFEKWGEEVLRLTNIERANYGLSPLTWDESLSDIAQAHCADMIQRNFFAHDNPDGLSPFDRIKNAGISYFMAAENIAAGQPSPEAVVEAWMNSSGHRANILTPDFEKLGVGVMKGGSYGIYWTQVFLKPV